MIRERSRPEKEEHQFLLTTLLSSGTEVEKLRQEGWTWQKGAGSSQDKGKKGQEARSSRSTLDVQQ
eukprot:4016719-Prorocentrum_lima.AAC.1